MCGGERIFYGAMRRGFQQQSELTLTYERSTEMARIACALIISVVALLAQFGNAMVTTLRRTTSDSNMMPAEASLNENLSTYRHRKETSSELLVTLQRYAATAKWRQFESLIPEAIAFNVTPRSAMIFEAVYQNDPKEVFVIQQLCNENRICEDEVVDLAFVIAAQIPDKDVLSFYFQRGYKPSQRALLSVIRSLLRTRDGMKILDYLVKKEYIVADQIPNKDE